MKSKKFLIYPKFIALFVQMWKHFQINSYRQTMSTRHQLASFSKNSWFDFQLNCNIIINWIPLISQKQLKLNKLNYSIQLFPNQITNTSIDLTIESWKNSFVRVMIISNYVVSKILLFKSTLLRWFRKKIKLSSIITFEHTFILQNRLE